MPGAGSIPRQPCSPDTRAPARVLAHPVSAQADRPRELPVHRRAVAASGARVGVAIRRWPTIVVSAVLRACRHRGIGG
jgi:hypothetical protein